jgi:hypothetical protein
MVSSSSGFGLSGKARSATISPRNAGNGHLRKFFRQVNVKHTLLRHFEGNIALRTRSALTHAQEQHQLRLPRSRRPEGCRTFFEIQFGVLGNFSSSFVADCVRVSGETRLRRPNPAGECLDRIAECR